MRVVHASDWHGHHEQLPEADLYVFTGDMLHNFPSFNYQVGDDSIRFWTANLQLIGRQREPEPLGMPIERVVDPVFESMCQSALLRQLGNGHAREWLASRDAPVVVCRGNHDFVDLSDMFGGDVWEVTEDVTRTTSLGGLRFGGCRGINAIVGEWSDELSDPEWDDVVGRLPTDLDVLVTHAPPAGVMDRHAGLELGSRALRGYLNRRWMSGPPLRAHLFGHIHESHGTDRVDGTVLSNAATTWHALEL